MPLAEAKSLSNEILHPLLTRAIKHWAHLKIMATIPRIYHPDILMLGTATQLSPTGARHVQVLRLQPGQTIQLFTGQKIDSNNQYNAVITSISRSEVHVEITDCQVVNCELACDIHLAVGMPANERMDWLVEKATELGVASITPLMTQRSVIRLSGERARKKQNHWQAIAIAACEQCGRNQLPVINLPISLDTFSTKNTETIKKSFLLSLNVQAQPLSQLLSQANFTNSAITIISGPEGGLTSDEEQQLLNAESLPITLGSRVLRAETAALSALAIIGASTNQ